MANPSKAKGDRAEREAVFMFQELCGDLCVPKAMRLLGAGRAEDTGDLHVFNDTAIQVRNYKLSNIGSAVRSSAKDAVIQAGHGDKEYALGLVPYPRARAETVRWIACVEPDAWPTEALHVASFGTISRALDFARTDGPSTHPRVERIALLGGSSQVLVAPIEAWVAAYRDATNRPVLASDD